MSLKSEIGNLSEGVGPDELRGLFQKVLHNASSESVLETLIQLDELADRQWHTYELLDQKLASQLEAALSEICVTESLEQTELLLGIVAKLGLSKLFEKLKSRKPDLASDVRTAIDEFIAEVGNDVSDPFSGMK